MLEIGFKWERNHKDFEGAAGSRNSKDRLARPRRAAGVLQTQQNAEGLERIAKSRALPAHKNHTTLRAGSPYLALAESETMERLERIVNSYATNTTRLTIASNAKPISWLTKLSPIQDASRERQVFVAPDASKAGMLRATAEFFKHHNLKNRRRLEREAQF